MSRVLLNISKKEHFGVSRSAPAIPLCICYWRSRLYTNMHNASLKTHEWTRAFVWACICPIPQSIILLWCTISQSHSSASLPQPIKENDLLLTQLHELAQWQITEMPAWVRRRDWNCMARGEMGSRQDCSSLCWLRSHKWHKEEN